MGKVFEPIAVACLIFTFLCSLPVRTAAAIERVYRLQTAGSDAALSFVNTQEFSKNKYEIDEVVLAEVRVCRNAHLSKCPVWLGHTGLGTGFFVVSGDIILTTLHTFESYLRGRWQVDPAPGEVEVPLLIFGAEGDLLFGNRPDDKAKLTIPNSDAKAMVIGNSLVAHPDVDVAVIHLSRMIGEPITLSHSELRTGQVVKVTGFLPSRQFGGVDDFQQRDRVEWSGTLLRAPRADNCTGTTDMNFADYRNAPGLSGAPVLNSGGEVVGVHVGECSIGGRSISLFNPTAKILLDSR